jgi:hypothetical protein
MVSGYGLTPLNIIIIIMFFLPCLKWWYKVVRNG